jgi:hypothetical protein
MNFVQKRSLIFDVSKGILVLVMLIHHAWSAIYISGPDHVRGVVSFVSAAFILYSGFLIGFILLNGYLAEPGSRLKRDVLRGAKLMLVFLFANAILYGVGYGRISEHVSFFIWLTDCLKPNPPSVAVFSLLNAFAHFFAGSAVVVYLCVISLASRGKSIVQLGVALASFVVALSLYYQLTLSQDTSSASAIIYGYAGLLLGVAASLLPVRFFQTIHVFGFIALAAYCLLSIMTLTGNFKPYEYYASFVLLGSLAVWKLSNIISASYAVKLARGLAFLGSYTLVSYMIQVIISKLSDLKIIDYYHFYPNTWFAFFQSTVLMAVVMVLVIRIIDVCRKKNTWIDYSYRTIFG